MQILFPSHLISIVQSFAEIKEQGILGAQWESFDLSK